MSDAELVERLARDLHDGPLQDVFATRLRLDKLADHVPPELGTELRKLSRLQDHIIQCMRRVGRIENEATERSFSERLVDTVTDATIALGFEPCTTIDTRLNLVQDPVLIADAINVVHECLSNVARHAYATEVDLSFMIDSSRLILAIADNGVGIPSHTRRGNGLANIRARAVRHGGDSVIRDADVGGTIIEWFIPLSRLRLRCPRTARAASGGPNDDSDGFSRCNRCSADCPRYSANF